MTINLSKLPDPKSTDTIAIGGINGGLNLRSEPTDLQSNQSPDMLNMWYRDGALRKRHGQKTLYSPSVGVKRRCVFYSRLFNGYLFWLEGDRFKYAKPDNLVINHTVLDITVDSDSERGTFIPFEEYLFYKAPGVYIKFYIDDTGDNPTYLPTGQYIIRDGEPVINNGVPAAYTPIIAINRNPDGTGGDSYQPENRINPYKTVWFDVDKTSTEYYLPVHKCDVTRVQIDDDYSVLKEDGWHKNGATTATESCIVGGRTVTFTNPETDDSSQFSSFNIGVPMDASETGWINTGSDYVSSPTSGGNFIGNVVYSNMDVYPHSSTVIVKEDVLRPSDNIPDDSLLSNHWYHILHQYATTEQYEFIVLESIDYHVINVIILPDVNGLEGHIVEVREDSAARPFRLKNYRNVSLNTDSLTITVSDYSGENKNWHHAINAVYTTVNYTMSNGQYLFQNQTLTAEDPLNRDSAFPLSHVGWCELYFENHTVLDDYRENVPRYSKSVVDTANKCLNDNTGEYYYWDFDTSGWVERKSVDLMWISQNNDVWAFHYRMPVSPKHGGTVGACASGNHFFVTGYENGNFGTYGFYRVEVDKHSYKTTFKTQYEKTANGFPLKNVLFAPLGIVWHGCAPSWNYTVNGVTHRVDGTPIVKRTGGGCPDEYKDYFEVAKMIVQSQNVTIGSDPNYMIASGVNGKYIGFWFEAKDNGSNKVKYNTVLSIDRYDSSDNGNCRMSGVSMSTKNTTVKDEEVELNLDTPAVLSNRIRVTYKKKNEDAFNAISDCKVAIDYGGSDSVCIVMGNCKAQPNAIFWSGNGSAGVDPTYFPMDQYNLVGTYQDGITSLAKYQSFLIVLQGHQTSKGTYSIENNTATNRNFIDISIATINPERGCDLPHTVQLCGNNLVWGNRTHGVLYLSDTSYANENSVLRISENINGNKYRSGLLDSLKDAENVCSLDDGQRYFLFVGDEAWVWDYSLGSVSDGIYNLSWTRHNGFNVQDATTVDSTTIYLLDSDGNINTISEKCDTDFGEDFPCHYVSPTQTFGGYYRKKDITQMIITAQSERGGVFSLEYGSERTSNPMKEQYVPLKKAMQMKLVEREFPTGIVVKPRVLHINNFYFRIDSDGRDGGLSIDNVVIMYTTGGANK